MKFESSRKHRIGVSCCAALSMLLASCGGGELVSEFRPQRIVAFGDQTSVITQQGQIDPVTQQAYAASGQKFTINALDATSGALLCQGNPNWVQYLAQSFALPFAQCNPDNVAAPSIDHAANGARVAELTAQVDAHLAADSFSGNDLVTVLVGANDVVEQYALYPAQSEATLIATLEQRGAQVAAQVNRIAAAGGKVIVSTVPDLGLTPFALAEKAAHDASDDRAALLSRLTARFNAGLRVGLLNESGRSIGLVLGDELVQTYVRFPSVGGLANVTDAACSAPLPDCTTATLVDAAKSSGGTVTNGVTYLWADSRELSATGHRLLGISADTRARNNPF
jgi:lysophospholipase L1-like esterase